MGWLNAANTLTERVVTDSDLFINNAGALGSAKLFFGSYGNLTVNNAMTLANDIQFGPDNPPHVTGITRYQGPVSLQVPNSKTLTLTGNITGDTVSIQGGVGYLQIDGNASFQHLLLGGFQGVDINGTVSGQAYPNGLHDANVTCDLFGNGTLRGIYGHGTVSPGPRGGAGRLTIETMTSFTYHCDLDGMTAGEDYDQLVLLNQLFSDYSGYTKPVLDADLTFAPLPGSQFVILDNQGSYAYSDLFAGLPEGGRYFQRGATADQLSRR